MRTFRLSLLCLFFCVTAVAQEPSEFKTPPTKFRPDPLWFWNNTDITKEGIDAQMPGFLEKCGYGGLAILPFGPNLTPKYLTEEYFERYKYAVEKAAELGLTLSLYDEYGFPSGSGGAINADGVPRFRNRFPNLTMKRLDKIEEETRGGATYVSPVSKTGQLMAAVAMNADTKERIDLSGNITEETIVWKVPEGNWKIMQFVCVADDDPNMDYLSEEAAKAYISMTHEAYYKPMPEFFGTTITSTFFDELDADIQRDLHKKIRLQPGAVLSGALVRHRPGNAGRAERPVRSAGRALRSGLSESGQRVEQSARHRCDRTSG